MPPSAETRRRDTGGVPILDRSLRVLDQLRLCPQGQSLTEIARALGYPKNTVYRILNTFCAHDYVRRDEATLHYTLSRKMATMAYSSAEERNLMENSLDVMRKLRDATRETVVISILDGDAGLVLEQVQSQQPFRFVCDAGTKQSIHTSASTKAILAFLPECERTVALQAVSFQQLTPTTITNRERFLEVLEVVQRDGYAVDWAEALDGVHCVAAPILNHQGYPVAALTVTGPAERIPAAEFARLGALVRQHAALISERLGHRLNMENKQER